MAATLLLLGAALLIAGTSALCWPAGLIVAGLCSIVAGVDLTRTVPVGEPDQ